MDLENVQHSMLFNKYNFKEKLIFKNYHLKKKQI